MSSIVEICPKCNLILKTVEENGQVLLKCGNCGFSKEFTGWTERECKACGYNKMTLEYFGVVIGDEQPLAMYKCIKCGAVEREGIS